MERRQRLQESYAPVAMGKASSTAIPRLPPHIRAQLGQTCICLTPLVFRERGQPSARRDGRFPGRSACSARTVPRHKVSTPPIGQAKT